MPLQFKLKFSVLKKKYFPFFQNIDCGYIGFPLHTPTHLSPASFLWDIGKQHSPRCNAAEPGVPEHDVPEHGVTRTWRPRTMRPRRRCPRTRRPRMLRPRTRRPRTQRPRTRSPIWGYSVCTEKFHRKIKNLNTPENESGLTLLTMMGESIRQIWV